MESTSGECNGNADQLEAGAAEPELAGPPELVVVVPPLGSFGGSAPPPHAMPASAPATARINTIATFFIIVLLKKIASLSRRQPKRVSSRFLNRASTLCKHGLPWG